MKGLGIMNSKKYKDNCCFKENTAIKNDCYNHSDSEANNYYKENTEQEQIIKEYKVDGMDCSSCAKTIEKSILQLSGITQASVNFSTGKLTIQAKNQIPVSEVPVVVKKLGYSITPNEPVKIKEELFRIEGMDCGSCAQTIEKHLSKLDEVQKVSVNFSNGSMTIQHTNSIEAIQQELKKIGYQGFPEQVGVTKNDKKADYSTRNLIISGISLIFGHLFVFLPISLIISNSLFALSIFISGWKPAKSAFYAVKSRSLDMNVLMISAAIGAVIIGEWSEGALVVFLFAIGNLLQNKTVEKTRRSVQGLMNLTPEIVWLKKDHRYIEMNITDVTVGDTLLVKAGEYIPLDGIVEKGVSTVDQSPITGESIPVNKEQGSDVLAGTINQEGSLEIRVTHLVKDSTISRIIQMVENAQANKAPSEVFIDKFAKIYTPIVFILALVVIIVPPLFIQADFSEWFYKGLELLVVACPCALIISTPVSIVSSIGNAAKNGVLIKGGTFVEKAGEITAIAFDKTGTITEGQPEVSQFRTFQFSTEKALQILASLESHTTHPVGKAIISYSEKKQIELLEITEFNVIPGKGIQGNIDGETYFAGSAKLFDSKVIVDFLAEIKFLEKTGHTIVFLGTVNKIIGIVAVTDRIRETSKATIQQLKAIGIQKTIMLTGDNASVAKKISQEAGINKALSQLLPEEKVEAIEALRKTNVTAMVGDGINDAPALAVADLGIAMGGMGTDTAIETADIVLIADNLEKLPYTICLSKLTLRIIKQNIIFSIFIKLIALIFIFPGWLTLWIAVLSDSGAAVLVTLNALRLTKYK